MMPPWLQVVSHINPLTYEVDGLRALMLAGGTSIYGLGWDFGILLLVTTAMITIAGRLYATIVT